MSFDSQLLSLAAMARRLVEHGLVRGPGGNVSMRWQDLCYITPTGAWLDRLGSADFVPLNINRENPWQLQRASSEYAMHLACYRARPQIEAVVHVHPPNCVALGCAGLSIKAITPDFYLAVGAEVPLLPYITPTTQELADAVGHLMVDHDAVLLRNHGLILAAANIEDALAHSLLVEETARMILLAHAATGTCSFIDRDQLDHMERTTGRYYRQPGS